MEECDPVDKNLLWRKMVDIVDKKITYCQSLSNLASMINIKNNNVNFKVIIDYLYEKDILSFREIIGKNKTVSINIKELALLLRSGVDFRYSEIIIHSTNPTGVYRY